MDILEGTGLIPRKLENRRRRLRRSAFIVGYGGTILGIAILFTNLRLLFPDQAELAALGKAWAISAKVDYLNERHLACPPPLAAAQAAIVIPRYAAWRWLWLKSEFYTVGGRLVSLIALMYANGFLLGSREKCLKHLLRPEVRTALACSMLRPGEVIGPYLTWMEAHRLIPLYGLQFVIALVASAFAWLPLLYAPMTGPADPWESAVESMEATCLVGGLGGLALLYLFAYPLPLLDSLMKIRLACRPRNLSGLGDPAFYRIIGEFIGLALAMAFGAVAACYINLYALSDFASHWSLMSAGTTDQIWPLLRSLLILLFSLGLAVYVFRLHRRVLRDQRRKCLEEYFRFD